MTTGSWRVRLSLRRASSTPRPSSFGSLMSRKTMSGGSEVARVTACSPSVAISTRYPSSSSFSLYICATAGSSSTNRTRTSSSSFFGTAVLKSCSTSKTSKEKTCHRGSHPGPLVVPPLFGGHHKSRHANCAPWECHTSSVVQREALTLVSQGARSVVLGGRPAVSPPGRGRRLDAVHVGVCVLAQEFDPGPLGAGVQLRGLDQI